MTIRGGSWPGPLRCAPCGSACLRAYPHRQARGPSWADMQVCPYVGVGLRSHPASAARPSVPLLSGGEIRPVASVQSVVELSSSAPQERLDH